MIGHISFSGKPRAGGGERFWYRLFPFLAPSPTFLLYQAPDTDVGYLSTILKGEIIGLENPSDLGKNELAKDRVKIGLWDIFLHL